MRRLLTAICVCVCVSSQAGSIEARFRTFGLIPVQNSYSQTWTEQELRQLLSMLQNLPSQVRQALWDQHAKPLRVYKNHKRPKLVKLFQPRHQLNIQIGAPKGPGEQRQLLHYLLHRYDQRKKVSESKSWRQISGWRNILGLWTSANNQDVRAYAVPRGLKNPREDFVTMAEYFILPPQSTLEDSIKCRTTKKFAFFKQHFHGYRSPLDRDTFVCRAMDHGFLDDIIFYNPISGKPMDLGPVNEKTVSGFELLYATPGTGDASEIAGHLLLRIKLNNRQAHGQHMDENPNDLVISFLANTDAEKKRRLHNRQVKPQFQCRKNWFDLADHGDWDFNAWQSITQSLKGLSGGFLTIMDRQTLAQTAKNYTIEEDRNLLRYRLNLTAAQKRRLLLHLYQVKKNYKAKYYFFNHNCASVLVKVIGQGLRDREIADFNPIVSPPNSLVALFIRKGLAIPVYPSFYSYRKKGFLAQERIRERFNKLIKRNPRLPWPDLKGLFVKREQTRLQTLNALRLIADGHRQLNRDFYQIANLIQEAEMVYSHKDLVCENYTSAVTAQARQWQKQLLKTENYNVASMNTERLLNQSFQYTEARAYRQGLPHTKLLAPTVGLGHSYSQGQTQTEIDTGGPVILLGLALEQQEMGSFSNTAMQRSSYVKLGAAQLTVPMSGDRQAIEAWRFTGLKIRKFKERLNRVPSYFQPSGTMGLGLTVLDFNTNRLKDYSTGSLIAGELLFNLFSSEEFQDFVFVSIGAGIHRQRFGEQVEGAMALPLHAESLMSFRNRRKWQWRTKLDYLWRTSDRLVNELHVTTELNYRLSRARWALTHLKFYANYSRFDDVAAVFPTHGTVGLGLEWSRW